MAGVSDSAKQKLKGYWPGKTCDENQDMRMTTAEKAFPCHDDFVKKDDDPLADPRLRRLAETKKDNPEEIRAYDHRRIRKAECVSIIDLEEEEEDDPLVETRKRIRENVLQRQQEEEDASLLPEEEEEEESEYEYNETDSDEQPGIAAMFIPVFVIKSERDTIAERERLEAQDRVLQDLTKERLKKRKIETKQIVAEEINKDEQIQKNIKLVHDADVDMNEEVEDYETWKVREIARTKRDRDNRQVMSKDKEEIARIRNMTKEETRAWERKNPKPAAPTKQKWRYYHKGAFYQTDSDDRSSTAASYNLFYCDFSAPTGEDKMNKTMLPKVKQVENEMDSSSCQRGLYRLE